MLQKGFSAILFPKQFLVTFILALEKPKATELLMANSLRIGTLFQFFSPVQLVNKLQVSAEENFEEIYYSCLCL